MQAPAGLRVVPGFDEATAQRAVVVKMPAASAELHTPPESHVQLWGSPLTVYGLKVSGRVTLPDGFALTTSSSVTVDSGGWLELLNPGVLTVGGVVVVNDGGLVTCHVKCIILSGGGVTVHAGGVVNGTGLGQPDSGPVPPYTGRGGSGVGPGYANAVAFDRSRHVFMQLEPGTRGDYAEGLALSSGRGGAVRCAALVCAGRALAASLSQRLHV